MAAMETFSRQTELIMRLAVESVASVLTERPKKIGIESGDKTVSTQSKIKKVKSLFEEDVVDLRE